MKYCVRCGRPLDIDDEVCSGCGMKQPYVDPSLLENTQHECVAECSNAQIPSSVPSASPTTFALVPVYNRPMLPSHKKGVIPYLVWSLLLLPFCNIIGTPFAVAAAFFVLAADAGEYSDCERRLNKASLLCIIATVINAATLIFLIFSTFAAVKEARGF